MYHSLVTTPPSQTEAMIHQFIMHLVMINNQHPHKLSTTLTTRTHTLLATVMLIKHTTRYSDASSTHATGHCDTNTISSYSETASSSPISSESSTSSSCDSNVSATTTVCDRQLQPWVPINYNEAILRKLHSRPQVTTLNSVSIPLPDTDIEDMNCSIVSTVFHNNELD